MATFTNAIVEATEWKFKAFVKNNELNVTNKSGRTIIIINAAGEITYQAAGFTNSAAEIASKVVAKPILEKNETVKVEQVKEKTFNTGFGYYGTKADANRGFDGIE